MKSLIILGRQPEIGLAELESLYGSEVLQPLESAVLIDLPPNKIDFVRLGGSIKLAEVLTITSKSELKNIIFKTVKKIVLPDSGKLIVGISSYNLDIQEHTLHGIGLSVKKILKSRGYNARVVPNPEKALSSAQVYHNKLTSERGIELLLVDSDKGVVLARTTAVQDIEAYAARDQNRPKRDARIGMLPPKLAQIIINLASNSQNVLGSRLLDPFCGTGVILQEALLMGFDVYGTDVDTRMVDYSRTNIDWLLKRFSSNKNVLIEVGDAKNYRWKPPINIVATETYLGKPLGSIPSDAELQEIIDQVNILNKKIIRNIHGQLGSGTRLCLAVPAWSIKNRFIHLSFLDQLEVLGYNRVAFKHSDLKSLVYHRPGQIVARELVTLIRN